MLLMTEADLFVGTHLCSSCDGRVSAEDCFWRSPSGVLATCRPCQRERRRAWYERNTERAKADSTRWKRENPAAWRAALRKSKYGMPVGGYELLLAEQDGGCAICALPPTPEKALAVDHDHQTGAIRGLLCDRCNRGIGMLGDDSARLDAAAAYLRSHA